MSTSKQAMSNASVHRSTRLAAALCLMLGAGGAFAQADRQAAALARAFAYDYNLKDRAGDAVVVAVLYRPGSSESEQLADGWIRSFKPLEAARIQGLPFKAVKLPWDGSIRSQLASRGVDILLVCDGLDAEAAAIRELARAQKLLTVGGKETYVEGGLTLGVFTIGDRMQIWVNLKAANAEGVNFSSDLLRLAKVLK